MPANYTLLEKITVGAAGASSVTFSGIPQTGYTDLVVKWSGRDNQPGATANDCAINFNGSATSFTGKRVYGNGTSALSDNQAPYAGSDTGAGATASTFSNNEIYIPNYTGSTNKSFSLDSVTERNATEAYQLLYAGLWSNTAAITSISIVAPSTFSFTQYSTFYLYGVAKLGTTPAIVPYATGGDTIMTDGTYWYHAFKSSGTFTPAKGLSCDVLVVAGGGGGGSYRGGGGGAGGVLAFSAQSLASGTGQTVTIGAGGAGGTAGRGTSGSNTTFGSLTAAVGGGNGGSAVDGANATGANGGSGGGGVAQLWAGGTGTSGQGSNGGTGNDYSGYYGSGGGGGASAAGSNGTSAGGGVGGAGTTSVTNWGALTAALTATGLGVSNYIAGGGAGGAIFSAPTISGGSGGGGNSPSNSNGGNGTANTGSGGGGANSTNDGTKNNGGAGGSGLVIVRYAV